MGLFSLTRAAKQKKGEWEREGLIFWFLPCTFSTTFPRSVDAASFFQTSSPPFMFLPPLFYFPMFATQGHFSRGDIPWQLLPKSGVTQWSRVVTMDHKRLQDKGRVIQLFSLELASKWLFALLSLPFDQFTLIGFIGDTWHWGCIYTKLCFSEYAHIFIWTKLAFSLKPHRPKPHFFKNVPQGGYVWKRLHLFKRQSRSFRKRWCHSSKLLPLLCNLSQHEVQTTTHDNNNHVGQQTSDCY